MIINTFYLLVLFVILNIRTLWLMGWDKRMAIKNDSQTGKGRISENQLLYNALMAGFLGIGVGMLLFRHKIRKPYFWVGVPVLAVLNIGLYLFLYQKLAQDFGWNFVYDLSILESIHLI